MAAAAAGIFSHQMTAGQALAGKTAMPMASSSSGTSGTSGSSDASGDSATISANDFLTLLVTEMQNQDPTADTDPNEYINQLVQVNSLEQLIDINQTLTTGLDGTSASSGNGASGQVAAATPGVNATSPAGATASSHGVAHASKAMPAAPGSAPSLAPGNLGVPAINSAAQQVAHALGGRTRVRPAGNSISSSR
jgi:flagellar basal-body rod modification protein FlgD